MKSDYYNTRDKLETYFDRTASKAWEVLTTDLPVSGVRQKVREGRNMTKEVILSSLPIDLTGKRILDAGCGTGQISIELAERGCEVVGIDISSSLINVAKKRIPPKLSNKIFFEVGDMTDEKYGKFDYIVAMDSLIHYGKKDIALMLSKLIKITKNKIFFTVTPYNMLFLFLLNIGKIFPKKDRSPDISPIKINELKSELLKYDTLKNSSLIDIKKISHSFYISQAMVLEK